MPCTVLNTYFRVDLYDILEAFRIENQTSLQQKGVKQFSKIFWNFLHFGFFMGIVLTKTDEVYYTFTLV